MATAPARQLNNKVCTRFDIPSSLVLIKQVKENKLLPILSVNALRNIRLKTYHTGNEIVHRLLVLTSQTKIQWSVGKMQNLWTCFLQDYSIVLTLFYTDYFSGFREYEVPC